jgi:hypothetical protein
MGRSEVHAKLSLESLKVTDHLKDSDTAWEDNIKMDLKKIMLEGVH